MNAYDNKTALLKSVPRTVMDPPPDGLMYFTVLFLGANMRCILLGVIAAILVAVAALVLACAAITMSTMNKSEDETKRLEDLEKRFRNLEQQLNIQGGVEKPEVSEIRPGDALQISIWTSSGGRKYPAGLAADGNDNTHMYTNRHTNPWWCADLQDIYHIKRVVVTNRMHSEEAIRARATNLRVGVTSTRPQVGENLALDAYTLCEEKPGYMGPIGIVNCPDGVSGQYVIVQFQVANNHMHIAEVKIYGYKETL